jgi:hypothetical protein
MIILCLLSGQLYTWSGDYARCLKSYPATPPQISLAKTAATRSGAAWLAHRTLQALWQTWLQVCSRPRPWTEVLLIGQSPRRTPANGLRSSIPSRTGATLPVQLPADTRHPRSALRHQPRVVAPSRNVLSAKGEPLRPPVRYHPRCHRYCQHAPSLVGARRYPSATGAKVQ